MIPYGRQEITDADLEAVKEVLCSDWLTQGPAVERFEAALCDVTAARHAVAVSNATAALHIGCLALGLGPGDRLWTSPITFVASANCGRYCGAEVDFVDVDPETYNMCPRALEAKLGRAETEGTLPKVLVVVHFSGQSADMAAISALARRHGIRIIEDASHAIGGRYLDQPIGRCDYSDITVFSFHPVKIVTTGEGGAAVTNSEALARSMRSLRSHGITRDAADMEQAPDGPWYYEQLGLGFNYRMTHIQAALGSSQLARLHDYVRRRHELADRYDVLLKDLPLMLPCRRADSYSALHLYVVRVHGDDARDRRLHVFNAMRRKGIGVNVHYIPVHLQPYYRKLGFAPGDFPAAEKYYEGAFTIPLYSSMSDEDQDTVVRALREVTVR